MFKQQQDVTARDYTKYLVYGKKLPKSRVFLEVVRKQAPFMTRMELDNKYPSAKYVYGRIPVFCELSELSEIGNNAEKRYFLKQKDHIKTKDGFELLIYANWVTKGPNGEPGNFLALLNQMKEDKVEIQIVEDGSALKSGTRDFTRWKVNGITYPKNRAIQAALRILVKNELANLTAREINQLFPIERIQPRGLVVDAKSVTKREFDEQRYFSNQEDFISSGSSILAVTSQMTREKFDEFVDMAKKYRSLKISEAKDKTA